MKYLKLLLMSLLFFQAARAQNLEAGLELGTVTTNHWIRGYDPNISYHVTGRFHKNQGLHWQNGIRLDVEGISADKLIDSAGASLPEKQIAKFGSPMITFALYSNYRYTKTHYYLYGGGTLGFVVCSLPDNNITPFASGKGFLLGLQVGGVLWLVNHIGISAEASPRYNRVSWEHDNKFASGESIRETKGFMTYPFLAGIRVRW